MSLVGLDMQPVNDTWLCIFYYKQLYNGASVDVLQHLM